MSDTRDVDTGVRYSDDVRELAYQLWTFVASRRAAEVSRLLALPEHGGHAVTMRTIQRWSAGDDWAQRSKLELRAIAPAIHDGAVSDLVLAVGESAAYVYRVASGKEDAPDISDILAMHGVDEYDRKLMVDARVKSHAMARRDRITATLATLRMAGFSDRPTSPAESALFVRDDDTAAIAPGKLTQDQRDAIQDRLLSRGDSGDR